jgi:FMN phosphatase YigB (HAD superfamily)
MNNWAGLFGIVVFAGLNITSMCFAIEMLILQPYVYPKIGVRAPEIPLLGKLEARGKSTIYLSQVAGQYIMHLNISIGVFILWVVYATYSVLHLLPQHFRLYSAIGIVVIIANAYASVMFSRFSEEAASGYGEVVGSNNAIVLDLDNTLVKTYEIYMKANMILAKWVRTLGAKIPDLDSFVHEIFELDRGLVAKHQSSDFAKGELLREICAHVKVKPKNEKEVELAYVKALEQIPEMKDHAFETLAILRKKRCNMTLLSEGKEDRIKKIAAHYKFDQIFDKIIPVKSKDLVVFERLAKDLRDQGYSTVYYVGDSIKKDISTANLVGFETVWLPSKWELNFPENPTDWPRYRIQDLIQLPSIVT